MKKIFAITFAFLVISPKFAENINDAYILIKNEKYEKAAQVLEEIIKKEKDFATAYTNLGFCYWKLGKNDKALSAYQRSYEIAGGNDSLLGLQWTYLSMKDFSKSAEYGKKVLAADPYNYNAEFGLAEANFENHNYKEALSNYEAMESKHGKTEYTSLRKSICLERLGKDEEADVALEETYKKNPKSKEVRSYLGLEPKLPYFYLTPEMSGYKFSGSDVIGSGNRYGLRLDFGFNDTWAFRLSYQNSFSDNLYAKNGVNRYIFQDNYNQLQYVLYNFNQSSINYYLNLPLNKYNMYSIINTKDYIVNYYDAGVTYRSSPGFKITANVFSAQSPSSSFIGNASAAKVSFDFGTYLKYGVALGGISFPKHTGGQADIHVLFPFLKYFHSYTSILGQYISKKETEYLLYSTTPVSTISTTVTKQLNYGLVQQEIGFTTDWIYLGIGGKAGNALTPIIGDAWIYTPFTYKQGGYAYVGKNFFKWMNVKLEYSQDYWVDTLGSNTVSRFGKISITARF